MEEKTIDLQEMKKMVSQMVGYMDKFGLCRLKLKSGTLELELEKPNPLVNHAFEPSSLLYTNASQSSKNHQEIKPSQTANSSEGHLLTAPIVGTFYNSSSPSSSAFVKLGDRVEEGSIVCIIEAMKVMNEVRAGKNGVIAEIYVENGHPVEFGTKMMRIV
jgi:acetyl-CoA carboxylase biotin carboxyl carrier protein